MIVNIKISPHVIGFLCGDQTENRTMEIADGTTLAEIMNILNVPDDLDTVMIVNDVLCSDRNRVMRDHDFLQLLPLIVGG